jgi:tripartite-type tricarboxylate transporter receptor subunit TctC
VRIIVGYPPGGANSTVARLVAQWLQERLGQPFIVENRPGAANNLATEAVVRAPGDGYTLLLADSANAINATLYDKLNFNFIRDIAPVASIMAVPLVFEVNPSVPARTVPEFIAYAKAHPGKINMASGGSGHTTHLSGELFKSMTGVDMVHVPYRGGAPALTDLTSGRLRNVKYNDLTAIMRFQFLAVLTLVQCASEICARPAGGRLGGCPESRAATQTS